MSEVTVTGESKIIRTGDAALDPKTLIHRYHVKPKGRVLRPIARLCGCMKRDRGSECSAPGAHDDRETEGEYRARIEKARSVECLVICTPMESFDCYGAGGRMWPRGQTRTMLHPDEIEEMKAEHGRIEVVTIAEMHSRVQVPDGIDDPVAYFEAQLVKAKAAQAAKDAPPAEVTPEVAALPPGPVATPTAPAKPKK